MAADTNSGSTGAQQEPTDPKVDDVYFDCIHDYDHESIYLALKKEKIAF